MIVKDSDAIKRLQSPMNLINSLRSGSRSSAMSLFIPPAASKSSVSPVEHKPPEEILPVKQAFNPFEKPSAPLPAEIPPKPLLEEILEDHESQIKLALAHDKALDLLTNSVNTLATKLDDVKADKLPAVIREASRVVDSIRRERNEASKNNRDREVHYHFYTPKQKEIAEYEVIDVG